MSKLDDLIQQYCPNGVVYKTVGSVVPVNRGRRLTKSELNCNSQYEVYHGSKDTILGYYKDYNAPKETVIVVNTGGIGGVKFVEKDFWCSDGSFWLGKSNNIVSKYLYYCLSGYEDYFYSKKRAGGVPTIDRSVIESFEIPVPPMEVQREIVHILDSFTLHTAELSAELSARRKQYNYYRDSLILDDVYERKTIKEIETAIYRGSGIKREHVTTDGIPCVRYGEIYTTYNTWFDTCKAHTVIENIESPKWFEYGDILFAITGENIEDIAKSCAYVGHEKCLAGGDIVVLKHNQNPKYLAYALETADAIKQKGKGKTKSKVVHSSVPAIEQIELPIPPMDIQDEIVEKLDKFKNIYSDLAYGLPAEIEARQRQYEYYRDQLLNFKRIN